MASDTSTAFWQNARQAGTNTWNQVRSTTINANNLLNTTTAGRGFKQGVLESFGWIYDGDKSQGFAGLGDNKAYQGFKNARQGGQSFSASIKSGFSGAKGALKGMSVGKFAFSAFTKALAPGFVALSVYQGYKEGGTWGATKAVAQSAIEWGVIRAGMAVLGSAGGALAIGTVGAGVGLYQYGKAAGAYGKRMSRLEMGQPVQDPFGTVATARQRGLMALQNTHLNARMTLGNEASLMHSNHYRRY